jgi:hypothetical protein
VNALLKVKRIRDSKVLQNGEINIRSDDSSTILPRVAPSLVYFFTAQGLGRVCAFLFIKQGSSHSSPPKYQTRAFPPEIGIDVVQAPATLSPSPHFQLAVGWLPADTCLATLCIIPQPATRNPRPSLYSHHALPQPISVRPLLPIEAATLPRLSGTTSDREPAVLPLASHRSRPQRL